MFMLSLFFLLASSSFVRPVLIIRADKTPYKWKPGQDWTKLIPNEKFSEFCVYDITNCSDEIEKLNDSSDKYKPVLR